MRLAADASSRAKPGFGDGSRRWLHDAALATLGRAPLHCPARRSLASLASDKPDA
jgi:hypothetical protein